MTNVRDLVMSNKIESVNYIKRKDNGNEDGNRSKSFFKLFV